jgi:Uma2 family endonuclease
VATAPKPVLPTDMTTQEFFAWPGDGSGLLHQLIDGQVVAISPPSSTHGVIQSTIARLLGNHIAANGLPCTVTTNPPVVPRIDANRNARCPDLGVSCAKGADSTYELTEPLVLIEILSPSNKAETWTNVWAFTTIPSVMDILVVESLKIGAKRLTRQADGTWPDVPVVMETGDTLEVPSLQYSVSLDRFYDGSRLGR